MVTKVFEGSSLEEVIAAAAAEFGVAEADVSTKVLDEEKAFFGLFGRKLRVECWVQVATHNVAEEQKAPEVASEKQSEAETKRRPRIEGFGLDAIAKSIFAAANLDVQVVEKADKVYNLTGPDSELFKANHAEGLKALEYLVNVLNRNMGPCPRIRFDVDDFRTTREAELEQMAIDAAREAMNTKRTVMLPPMENWERRLIHVTLKDSLVVETHSLGVEPNRRVALRLKGTGAPDWSDEENRLRRRMARREDPRSRQRGRDTGYRYKPRTPREER